MKRMKAMRRISCIKAGVLVPAPSASEGLRPREAAQAVAERLCSVTRLALRSICLAT